MFAYKQFVTVLGVMALGFLTMVSTRADTNVNKTTYLTFNRPVSLPGVTLGSGTYIFELPDATHVSDVVRVLSRDRSIVYFTAFTIPVQRPVGMSANRPITFAEARPDVPQPIAVWWPQDESTGRQFIYPKH
jgi:hypothetical protein